eukprot:c54721_g1_i1 orf=694-897(+)
MCTPLFVSTFSVLKSTTYPPASKFLLRHSETYNSDFLSLQNHLQKDPLFVDAILIQTHFQNRVHMQF